MEEKVNLINEIQGLYATLTNPEMGIVNEMHKFSCIRAMGLLKIDALKDLKKDLQNWIDDKHKDKGTFTSASIVIESDKALEIDKNLKDNINNRNTNTSTVVGSTNKKQ